MEHRDSLITRIDKSSIVIEDTKEACRVAISKKNDLYMNLLKNKKRVQELAAKDYNLSCDTENERSNAMVESGMMDLVAQELNARNGDLLQLEVTVEELQNKREMLEENLKYCESQIRMHEKRNVEIENRIEQLRREYFINESS